MKRSKTNKLVALGRHPMRVDIFECGLSFPDFKKYLLDPNIFWAEGQGDALKRWETINSIKGLLERNKIYESIQEMPDEVFFETPYYKGVQRYVLNHFRYRCQKCNIPLKKEFKRLVYGNKLMRGCEIEYLSQIFALCEVCRNDFAEIEILPIKENIEPEFILSDRLIDIF